MILDRYAISLWFLKNKYVLTYALSLSKVTTMECYLSQYVFIFEND